MAKRMPKMIKVIYFDEGSATDFIYVLGGGKNTDRKEHIVDKTTQIAVGADAEIGKSAGIFSVLTAKIGLEGNADLSREGSTIITKAVENTILTDYLSCMEKDGKQYIRVFKNCKLYPYPQSFAFFKMVTPYLKMTNGDVELANGLSINLAMIDEALDSGRGYYELMVEDKDETAVLRFNNKAFRNNYFISDLVKMNLDYHGIEVGTVDLGSLTMQSEFDKSKEPEINGRDIMNDDEHVIKENEIKVYDVLLAGVSR